MEKGHAYALQVVAGPASEQRLAIGGDAVEIGRHSGGPGTLGDDRALSRRHARVTKLRDGRLLIEDVGSSGGTFVNGARIGAPTILSAGDEIELGASTLRVVAADEAQDGPTRTGPGRQPALRVLAGFAPGALVSIGTEAVKLGRAAEGARVFGDDPQVAEEHVRVSVTSDGRLLVEDLGSEAGTYLGDARIAAPTLASRGERLRVGGTTFELVEAVAKPGAPSGVSHVLGGVRQVPEGLFARIGKRAPVTIQDVMPVFAIALGWAFAANLLVRSFAIDVGGVSDDLESLKLHQLLPATFFPVLGNSLGFFMSFRRPNDRSVLGYMIPTLSLPVFFVILGLVRLEDHGAFEVVTTLALVILPVAISVPLMFRLRARVARERVGAIRRGDG